MWENSVIIKSITSIVYLYFFFSRNLINFSSLFLFFFDDIIQRDL